MADPGIVPAYPKYITWLYTDCLFLPVGATAAERRGAAEGARAGAAGDRQASREHPDVDPQCQPPR